jgi:hypothetical protein
MSTKFFTNSNKNTLLRKFEGVFENNKDIQIFDALVGFFVCGMMGRFGTN